MQGKTNNTQQFLTARSDRIETLPNHGSNSSFNMQQKCCETSFQDQADIIRFERDLSSGFTFQFVGRLLRCSLDMLVENITLFELSKILNDFVIRLPNGREIYKATRYDTTCASDR